VAESGGTQYGGGTPARRHGTERDGGAYRSRISRYSARSLPNQHWQQELLTLLRSTLLHLLFLLMGFGGSAEHSLVNVRRDVEATLSEARAPAFPIACLEAPLGPPQRLYPILRSIASRCPLAMVFFSRSHFERASPCFCLILRYNRSQPGPCMPGAAAGPGPGCRGRWHGNCSLSVAPRIDAGGHGMSLLSALLHYGERGGTWQRRRRNRSPRGASGS
jgi:hypothetical protein